jgi:RimJ/RimL family protein N-acetyltransferase/glutaredoxin
LAKIPQRIEASRCNNAFLFLRARRFRFRQSLSLLTILMQSKSVKIIAYLKPHCGWSRGVRAVLDKYNLAYEDRDIINDAAQRAEMVQKSRQNLSPCVEVDGRMLADISGEELEHYLLSQSLVQPSSVSTEVPLDQGCPGHGDIPANVVQVNVATSNATAGFIFKSGQQIDLTSLLIQGSRIVLAPIDKSLAPEIYREFTPEVTQYMYPKPADSVEQVEEIIEIFADSRRKNEDLVSAVLLRDTHEFLGCCGLHARDNGLIPELGLWIKKGAHGNKYGREAIHTLVAWATEHLALEGFTYPVDKRNVASRRIPESLAGRVVAEKMLTSQSGVILDEVVYFIAVERSAE